MTTDTIASNGSSPHAQPKESPVRSLQNQRVLLIASADVAPAADTVQTRLAAQRAETQRLEEADAEAFDFDTLAGRFDGVVVLALGAMSNRMFGGMRAAGADALALLLRARLPVVVAPGGLDGVTFGERSAVPLRFSRRRLLEVAHDATRMRTDISDNARLGRWLAETLNQAAGPIGVCLPLRGLSTYDRSGESLGYQDANMTLFGNLTTHLRRDIRLHDSNAHINDPAFAALCVDTLTALLIPESPTE